jgi:hypothetical protein
MDDAGSHNWGDPASDAARVIEDEALSIFLAVDAATSEIDADARRRAELIRRASDEATVPALARLDAMSRTFDALVEELDERARTRAAREGNGD